MTISAEALRELMALGIRGEKLAAVVTIFERDASRHASRDGRDDKQKAADRSRNYRIRKRDGGVTSVTKNVTLRDDLHIDKNLTSLEDLKIKKVRKKTISAPLPADWKPSPVGRAFAITKKAWDDQHIDSEGERFRDHSLAKGLNHRDVEAAWRNWVTSPYQSKSNGARASPGNLPRPGSREDRQEKTYNAYQKLREYAHPQADDARHGGVADDPTSGLLPFPKPA